MQFFNFSRWTQKNLGFTLERTGPADYGASRLLGEKPVLFLQDGLAVDASDFSKLESRRHNGFSAVDAMYAVEVGACLGCCLSPGLFKRIFVELRLNGRCPIVLVGKLKVVFILFKGHTTLLDQKGDSRPAPYH